MLDTVDEPDEPVIRRGRRVEYRGQGAYHGARGKVLDVWANGEMATVEMGETSITRPPEYFEPVTYDD